MWLHYFQPATLTEVYLCIASNDMEANVIHGNEYRFVAL